MISIGRLGVYNDESGFYKLEKQTTYFPRPKTIEVELESESDETDQDEKIDKQKSQILLKFENVDDISTDLFEIVNILGKIINENFTKYDAFVLLVQSDLIPDAASYLSFMLKNLTKPVVLTDAQIPINELRTDVILNFSGSVIIAANVEGEGFKI